MPLQIYRRDHIAGRGGGGAPGVGALLTESCIKSLHSQLRREERESVGAGRAHGLLRAPEIGYIIPYSLMLDYTTDTAAIDTKVYCRINDTVYIFASSVML